MPIFKNTDQSYLFMSTMLETTNTGQCSAYMVSYKQMKKQPSILFQCTVKATGREEQAHKDITIQVTLKFITRIAVYYLSKIAKSF